MKWKTILLVSVLFASSLYAPAVRADTAPGDVIISEVLPGTSQNGREEFIELYNASPNVIDFSGGNWAVQLASSAAKDWSSPIRTIHLDGFLYPTSHYLIGSTFTQTVSDVSSAHVFPEAADVYYSSALSATAGHIRVVHSDAGKSLTTSDEFEWGTATTQPLGGHGIFRPTKAIAGGSSFTRQLVDQHVSISGDATTDFAISLTPTPETNTADQPIPEPDDTDADTPLGDPVDPGSQVTVALPKISELLPNPASPQTDASDEYIELYNPGSEPFNLKGYGLQVGLGKRKTYTFTTDTYIPAGAYLALYSKQTKLALSNTASQAFLINPAGDVISQSAAYSNALEGAVWQYRDGAWSWSAKPTPGADNEAVTVPAATAGKTTKLAEPKKTATKQTASKAVATHKPKAEEKSKTTKKTAKKKVTKTDKTKLTAATTTAPKAMIHTTILVLVLVIALLYGAYEYRHDLAVRIKRLANHRADRAANRNEAAGRRSD